MAVSSVFSIETPPRAYQQEAVKWALKQERAVCCLPTGTGKTLVGMLWVKELADSERAQRVLLLEPTRLLVKQTTNYYGAMSGTDPQPIDGTMGSEVRREKWRSARLVVATPHSAFNDRQWVAEQGFDAVVVDECHHTVGQEAFARFMDEVKILYRLGLSATIPKAREADVERRIGRIRRWSWDDPEIRPFVPDWIGEVFDADLSLSEEKALRAIRQLEGAGRERALLERFLTRDGLAAVGESLEKHTKLAEVVGPHLNPLLAEVRSHLHKMSPLKEVLDSHDFDKAMVFVDRKVVARAVAHELPHLNPVLLLGGSDRSGQEAALKMAQEASCKLVVATRAGEEGIDLPDTDLLVLWGSVASEIRFIQRHGRIMRRVSGGATRLKSAVFIVTPDTVDYDSFVQGLERVQQSNHVNLEKTFGWDPNVLWPKTTWWHLTEALSEAPQPLENIERTLGVRGHQTETLVQSALRRGRLFYYFDVHRLVRDFVEYAIKLHYVPSDSAEYAARLSVERAIRLIDADTDEQWESWARKLKRFSTGVFPSEKAYRVYALSEKALDLRRQVPRHFASSGDVTVSREPLKAGFSWLFLKKTVPAAVTEHNLSEVQGRCEELQEALNGEKIGHGPRRKSRRLGPAGFSMRPYGASCHSKDALKFYFAPASEQVLSLLAANTIRLCELADEMATDASRLDVPSFLRRWLELLSNEPPGLSAECPAVSRDRRK